MDPTTQSAPSHMGLPVTARYLMAACTVLAPATVVAAIFLHPVELGVEGVDAIAQFDAQRDSYLLIAWLFAVSTFFWVVAILTLGRVARYYSRTLGLVGMVIAFGLAIPVSLNYEDLSYIALENNLEPETIVALFASADQLPSGILGVVWLAGLVGLILLGIAILRGKGAPKWAGVALIIAPLGIPASWFAASALVFYTAWVVLTAGFAGYAIDLVRHGNDVP
ncbi:hypothetical protein [Hoyosella subflava]|uniref:Integral membrane protein n=1 Tax=Hoyosella subflava (strain DSM 45089 / JCM 17490 / NBRC 109087 / DQS3-9A1) TaxID=443218 RepID=F6ELA1_HOYSD|nr:hypothetical protein [Hoyosella subflava]AEF39193.1 hypothetical protein AS9A_0739 [Hoyosella subflava DQS3-9A1]